VKTINVIGWHIGNPETISKAIIDAIYDADVIVSESGLDYNTGDSGWWHNNETKSQQFMLDNDHKLVNYYDIEQSGFEDFLESHNNIAIIVFEGMPGIQDPGCRLISAAFKMGGFNIKVTPGPDAPSSAMAASGFDGEGFIFAGYPQKDKEQALDKLRRVSFIRNFPIVMFFKDYQLDIILESIKEVFGPEEMVTMTINLSREDSSIVSGTVTELMNSYTISNVRDFEQNKCALVIENRTRDENS
jgi:16S rRNA C1402 (ribose-2'-O) methylase RsmI